MDSIDWLHIFALIRIEMKLPGNYRLIRNMMVVSQLMLLGLVVQWLSS
ncbi:MAG: hypothetical protein IH591_19905, partial [Bacteroidales bacterium]|nr:hypothetical protein [Bacteroidales bacterium]